MTDQDLEILAEGINKRIMQLISVEGMKLSEFADYLGIPRSRMTHIKNGRNKPNVEFIIKLLAKFPNLNPEWLLLGKGTMFKVSPHQQNATLQKEKDDKEKADNQQVDDPQPETPSTSSSTNVTEPENVQEPDQNAQTQPPINTQSSVNQQDNCATDAQNPPPAANKVNNQSVPGSAQNTQPAAAQPQPQPAGFPAQGQPVVIPGANGAPAQILILYPDRTFVAYRARDDF